MLVATQITRRFGPDLILDKVQLTINRGDRIGLIGPNGAGKSTLIRILVGLDAPDSGTVTRTPPDLRIGYLPQALLDLEQGTVDDVLMDGRGALGRAGQRLTELQDAMADPGVDAATLDTLLAEYAEAQTAWDEAG